MDLEIERKFLIPHFPKMHLEIENAKQVSRKIISQNYLAVGIEEIRVRKIVNNNDDKYTLTYKKGNSVERIEKEIPLLEETFEQLKSKYKPINKIRSTFLLNNQLIEIDEYENFDFCTIELEFNSLEESTDFIPPTWFGTEVTIDKNYKNQTLWKKVNNL